MDAEAPVDHESLLSRSVACCPRTRVLHSRRNRVVGLGRTNGAAERAQALTSVLTRGLQLVAINLTVNENSQEIFETLNARGTPLTAADLIRNFVFQRLAAEGADTRVHLDDWPFETEFWEKEVSVGRYRDAAKLAVLQPVAPARGSGRKSVLVPRSRGSSSTSNRSSCENGQKVADLLPVIRKQAETYEAWTKASDAGDRQLNRVELAVYRMKASDSELLKPLLIWLHEPGRGGAGRCDRPSHGGSRKLAGPAPAPPSEHRGYGANRRGHDPCVRPHSGG